MFSSSVHFVTLTLAAAGAVAQVQPIPCARTFTVRPNDTCDKIAASAGTSTFQVLASNFGTVDANCTNIFPGQVLCLRRACLNCNTVHVVQPGDDCTSIANAAGISVATMIASNPNLDAGCTNIYPGEVLCVSSTF